MVQKFIKTLFANRYRGTAVKQVDGTEIPPPFPPEDPEYVRKHSRVIEDPGHPLGFTSVPPERYSIEAKGDRLVIRAVDGGVYTWYAPGVVVYAERLEIADV